MKDRPDSSSEVRPIGWKMSLVTKAKAADFFSPHQFRVACPPGGEKVVHGAWVEGMHRGPLERGGICVLKLT